MAMQDAQKHVDHRDEQERAIRVALQTPEIQELLASGWAMTRVALPNGDIQIRLTFS